MNIETEMLAGFPKQADITAVVSLLERLSGRSNRISDSAIMTKRRMAIARDMDNRGKIVAIGSLFVLDERLPHRSAIIKDIVIDDGYKAEDVAAEIVKLLRSEIMRLNISEFEIIDTTSCLGEICKKLGFNVSNHAIRAELGM